MTIGQTIARLRKERGLTQEQLAEQLLVSRQATVFALGGAAALWVQFAADAWQYRAIVSHGPDVVRLLRQERETGVTVSYQQRLPLVMLRRDELSYPSGDSLKRQWLADDICAVTYVSRSDGISYDNVFSACYGSWSCRRRSTSRKMTPTTGSRPPISAATTGRI
ncbi:MAG: helix-turn-helix transcriptional regulator [Oscillospiraceae bacterium]|nr:helix-turn-helix transcriptional regulator [Oscillospiraceae bacterium]